MIRPTRGRNVHRGPTNHSREKAADRSSKMTTNTFRGSNNRPMRMNFNATGDIDMRPGQTSTQPGGNYAIRASSSLPGVNVNSLDIDDFGNMSSDDEDGASSISNLGQRAESGQPTTGTYYRNEGGGISHLPAKALQPSNTWTPAAGRLPVHQKLLPSANEFTSSLKSQFVAATEPDLFTQKNFADCEPRHSYQLLPDSAELSNTLMTINKRNLQSNVLPTTAKKRHGGQLNEPLLNFREPDVTPDLGNPIPVWTGERSTSNIQPTHQVPHFLPQTPMSGLHFVSSTEAYTTNFKMKNVTGILPTLWDPIIVPPRHDEPYKTTSTVPLPVPPPRFFVPQASNFPTVAGRNSLQNKVADMIGPVSMKIHPSGQVLTSSNNTGLRMNQESGHSFAATSSLTGEGSPFKKRILSSRTEPEPDPYKMAVESSGSFSERRKSPVFNRHSVPAGSRAQEAQRLGANRREERHPLNITRRRSRSNTRGKPPDERVSGRQSRSSQSPLEQRRRQRSRSNTPHNSQNERAVARQRGRSPTQSNARNNHDRRGGNPGRSGSPFVDRKRQRSLSNTRINRRDTEAEARQHRRSPSPNPNRQRSRYSPSNNDHNERASRQGRSSSPHQRNRLVGVEQRKRSRSPPGNSQQPHSRSDDGQPGWKRPGFNDHDNHRGELAGPVHRRGSLSPNYNQRQSQAALKDSVGRTTEHRLNESERRNPQSRSDSRDRLGRGHGATRDNTERLPREQHSLREPRLPSRRPRSGSKSRLPRSSSRDMPGRGQETVRHTSERTREHHSLREQRPTTRRSRSGSRSRLPRSRSRDRPWRGQETVRPNIERTSTEHHSLREQRPTTRRSRSGSRSRLSRSRSIDRPRRGQETVTHNIERTSREQHPMREQRPTTRRSRSRSRSRLPRSGSRERSGRGLGAPRDNTERPRRDQHLLREQRPTTHHSGSRSRLSRSRSRDRLVEDRTNVRDNTERPPREQPSKTRRSRSGSRSRLSRSRSRDRPGRGQETVRHNIERTSREQRPTTRRSRSGSRSRLPRSSSRDRSGKGLGTPRDNTERPRRDQHLLREQRPTTNRSGSRSRLSRSRSRDRLVGDRTTVRDDIERPPREQPSKTRQSRSGSRSRLARRPRSGSRGSRSGSRSRLSRRPRSVSRSRLPSRSLGQYRSQRNSIENRDRSSQHYSRYDRTSPQRPGRRSLDRASSRSRNTRREVDSSRTPRERSPQSQHSTSPAPTVNSNHNIDSLTILLSDSEDSSLTRTVTLVENSTPCNAGEQKLAIPNADDCVSVGFPTGDIEQDTPKDGDHASENILTRAANPGASDGSSTVSANTNENAFNPDMKSWEVVDTASSSGGGQNNEPVQTSCIAVNSGLSGDISGKPEEGVVPESLDPINSLSSSSELLDEKITQTNSGESSETVAANKSVEAVDSICTTDELDDGRAPTCNDAVISGESGRTEDSSDKPEEVVFSESMEPVSSRDLGDLHDEKISSAISGEPSKTTTDVESVQAVDTVCNTDALKDGDAQACNIAVNTSDRPEDADLPDLNSLERITSLSDSVAQGEKVCPDISGEAPAANADVTLVDPASNSNTVTAEKSQSLAINEDSNASFEAFSPNYEPEVTADLELKYSEPVNNLSEMKDEGILLGDTVTTCSSTTISAADNDQEVAADSVVRSLNASEEPLEVIDKILSVCKEEPLTKETEDTVTLVVQSDKVTTSPPVLLQPADPPDQSNINQRFNEFDAPKQSQNQSLLSAENSDVEQDTKELFSGVFGEDDEWTVVDCVEQRSDSLSISDDEKSFDGEPSNVLSSSASAKDCDYKSRDTKWSERPKEMTQYERRNQERRRANPLETRSGRNEPSHRGNRHNSPSRHGSPSTSSRYRNSEQRPNARDRRSPPNAYSRNSRHSNRDDNNRQTIRRAPKSGPIAKRSVIPQLADLYEKTPTNFVLLRPDNARPLHSAHKSFLFKLFSSWKKEIVKVITSHASECGAPYDHIHLIFNNPENAINFYYSKQGCIDYNVAGFKTQFHLHYSLGNWKCLRCNKINFTLRTLCFSCCHHKTGGFSPIVLVANPTRSVVIYNLSLGATEETVLKSLSRDTQFLPIKSARIVEDPGMKCSSGFCIFDTDCVTTAIQLFREASERHHTVSYAEIRSESENLAARPVKPDGLGPWTYPKPNYASFQLEPISGFQYDHSTQLYYDTKTSLFYNSDLRIYLKWDEATQKYHAVQ